MVGALDDGDRIELDVAERFDGVQRARFAGAKGRGIIGEAL